MITLFTTTKPFRGPADIQQRNTIQCWKRLQPACEILLIGEEEGSAEVAREYGVRLIRDVDRNENGTPILRSIFSIAEAQASFPLLMYANADILFTNRLTRVAQTLAKRRKKFLLFGRRTDTDISEPLVFSDSGWEADLEERSAVHGKPAVKSAYDYFLFPRGAWGGAAGLPEFPPLVIGRVAWDNWLIFWARACGLDVINASDFILAVHQNHDYRHHPAGMQGIYFGEEAKHNLAMASDKRYLYSTLDATHYVNREGIIKPLFSPAFLRRRIQTFPDLLRIRLRGRKKWKPG